MSCKNISISTNYYLISVIIISQYKDALYTYCSKEFEMSTLVFLFFFSLISNSICQIVPLLSDIVINQLRQQQYDYTSFDVNNYLDYNLIPEQMSSLFSSNETNTCEKDFELIFQAAMKREMWAIKIIDAWGKPLPSGVLSGNVYWVGNYDECLQEMYVPNNKSFISQPFDTQYCK